MGRIEYPGVGSMINAVHDALGFQAEALKLRAERQRVLAANIANADTPNYRAVDFDFAKALTRATAAARPGQQSELARTQAGQVSTAPATTGPLAPTPRDTRSGVDGNTVDMDVERVQFADNALRYESALRFLNGKIRTLLSAIQG